MVLSTELATVFDYNLKTTSVSFLNPDFNLLSCEFDSFKFKLLYASFYIDNDSIIL